MLSKFVNKKENQFLETISLISSENCLSKFVKNAFKTDYFNRYHFGEVNGVNIFPGDKYLGEIEKIVKQYLVDIVGSEYIDVSTISGLNCMQTVFYAFIKSGDIVFTINPEDGGHLITKKILEKLGCIVKFIPFNKEKFQIDYKLFSLILKKEKKNSFIYIDQMIGIYPISLLELDEYIDTSNIIKYYDVSHNFAFILGGLHKNPLNNGYNAFGGSTHKTIPGPHKGVFISSNIELFNNFIQSTKITVSHKHYSDILGLGLLLEEMKGKWKEYTKNIIKNIILFSTILDKNLYKVHCYKNSYSKSHQLLLFVRNGKLFEVFDFLKYIGIYVNLLPLPFSKKLGFRLGFQEITYLGFKKNDIIKLSNIFNNILKKDKEILKEEVKKLKILNLKRTNII